MLSATEKLLAIEEIKNLKPIVLHVDENNKIIQP